MSNTVGKAVEELITCFEEGGFSSIPMDGFERQSLKPKVIKFFTGDHRVMRKGVSSPVFDKIVEKFCFIFRKVKSIEFLMVVMPRNLDDTERSLIL